MYYDEFVKNVTCNNNNNFANDGIVLLDDNFAKDDLLKLAESRDHQEEDKCIRATSQCVPSNYVRVLCLYFVWEYPQITGKLYCTHE